MQSLYERFGGPEPVARLVFAFYDRVLKAPALAPYFAGMDMRRLVDHQAKVISVVMGGPASYTDEQIREMHAQLHIDDHSFDEMVDHLEETLKEFGFPDDDLNLALSRIRSRRGCIVRSPELHMES
jgi:hemoglobin